MNNNGTCISCPDDVNCDKDGSTLATVKLKPGAWRPNTESEEILECPIKNSCLGGISIETYVGNSFNLHCVSHTTLNETVQMCNTNLRLICTPDLKHGSIVLEF
jgi:hypothetical protein